MPAAVLLRYELTLFARSFGDAFGSWRDRLLLAIVLALAILWLRGAAAPDPPDEAGWLALAAAPLAFQWTRLVARRLDWLAEESALASSAAQPADRRAYLVAAQLPVLVPALLASAFLGGLAIGMSAYALGPIAARLPLARTGSRSPERVAPAVTSRVRGRHAAFLALLRVQMRGAPRPGLALLALLAANALVTAWGSRLALGESQGVQFAAATLPSFLLLTQAARNDARLVGFLAFAGYRAAFLALAVSAVPAASFAGAALGVMAGASTGWASSLAILALLHLGATLIAIARAWLSPGRDGRKVDFQVQVESIGMFLAGLILPPLALAALAARLWVLRRGYHRSLWLQP